MRPFLYKTAQSARDAISQASAEVTAHAMASTQYLAGGTTLIDLMKLDVMKPQALIDIKRVSDQSLRNIEVTSQGLKLGALVSMAQASEHETIKRDFPVLSQSLVLAASQQLRNMATLGGNVLQRTRCPYFRDVSYSNCNKRTPGSGCAAINGFNRLHAVLGTSKACIATYPGDWAQALMVLDASVDIVGSNGQRTISFADLHKDWGDTPHIETTLKPGELITAFNIPAGPHTRRSLYVKIRDRESYEFALASAAIALDLDGDKIRDIRIALGGVATKPWRARQAEQELLGKALDEATATKAAQIAFADATPYQHNQFKIKLGQETVVRALLQARAMEI